MEHIVLAIVEAERIPGGVLMTVTRIEELVRITCQITEALHLILHSVGVDDIHNYGNAIFMSGIDEFLQLLGSAKTT